MDANLSVFKEFLLTNHEVWQQYQPVFELWLASQDGRQWINQYRQTFHDWITTDPNVEMEVVIYELLMQLLQGGDHLVLV